MQAGATPTEDKLSHPGYQKPKGPEKAANRQFELSFEGGAPRLLSIEEIYHSQSPDVLKVVSEDTIPKFGGVGAASQAREPCR